MAPVSARAPLAALAAALGLAALAGATPPEAGAARVEAGVYQDDPVRGVPALRRAVGPRGVRVISTYVTAGGLVDPGVLALARRGRARLMVSWMPDAGRDGAAGPRLRRVARGAQARGLARLVRQIRGLRPAPILRPMPEPNTPWYAWSGTRAGNSAAAYRAAWTRTRRVVRGAGGRRVLLLWAPYARSVPEAPGNAIADYFPGAGQVDLVGASGYNFGRAGDLAWTEPDALFEDAYRQVTALAPRPFWIAETGTTARGGDPAAWIGRLGGLRATMPALRGVVWYDVRERAGDFRLARRATARAYRAFLARSAR